MAGAQAQLPVIQPRILLGIQTQIKGNVHFLTDEEVIYPVGGVLCIHTANQKKQKFIKMPEKGANIVSITLSSNKKNLAIAEIGDKPTIAIYDPWTCKKKKQLTMPIEKDIQSKEIVAVSFTADSKYLIVVIGEPDWLMIMYRVEKGRIENFTRANNNNNTGTVIQIACNPNDANLVVLVGQNLYRNLSCSENNWRQYGFNKAESLSFLCATWITQDRLFAGTNDGKLIYFDNAEIKAVYVIGQISTITIKSGEEIGQTASMIEEEAVQEVYDEPGHEVWKILGTSKGFLISYLAGTIHYFEKETANKYNKKAVFKIPDNKIDRSEEEFNDEFIEYNDVVLNEINAISVNVSEDRFLATCNETQIYMARLLPSEAPITMTPYSHPLHHGPIGCIAVCSWKPIFLSTGLWDRTLRLWNYDSESLEMKKAYTEDLHGCDLHPCGIFAVVGFSDKIRFMKILIDDFYCTREYPVRSCKLLKFSNLGHLFAAANGNIIQVYSSVTYEHLFNLKGHIGIVSGLSWSHDDYKLASCGTEGAVYEWQISTTRRICETIIKICQFSDIANTNDGKSNFGIGSDGKIREIVNSNVYGEVTVSPNGLDALALAHSDAMIFCTGNNGCVYSVSMPIADITVFSEAFVHSDRCTALKISFDDKYLISASKSCICVWKILNAQGKQVKLDKEFIISTEVMIERSDLVNNMALIKDLQMRMNELQTEHAYQMRQSEAAHLATIKEIHEGYCSAIEELKEKNESLEQEHNQEISNINMEINKMKMAHEMFVQKLEANYNEKLIVEYDKFMLLEEKMGRMRAKYDKELEDLAEAKRISEESITNNFVVRLQDKEILLEELREQMAQHNRDHETIKQQIEDDADRETYELKTQFEKELREEQDLNVKLRGETQASKKKLQASQKNIDDLHHSVQMHEIEQHKLKSVIFGLEGSISDLQKEIAERDSTIQDKEKRISELKLKNSELEKLKFILEFKIDELKSQIEPRDRTIREQTEQINDMVNELENLQKIVLSLELQLTELREKLKATDNEVKREVVKNRAAKASLKRIKNEIHNASGNTHDVNKLQKAVREMYHKYNADKDFVTAHAEDAEAKKEFLRQRDFLERTVRALKGQVTKEQRKTTDSLRLVEQNSELIVETNNLRKNLKVERQDNKRMTALLGLNNQTTNFTEGQRKLDMALLTRQEIKDKYQGKIDEEQQCLQVLQEENSRLLQRLTDKKTKHNE